MRIIKFRGLGLIDKKWHYGNLIRTPQGSFIFPDDSADIVKDSIKIVQETGTEFTSLKDKNKVEIYEGDIIKKPDFKSHTGKTIKPKSHEVVYDNGGFHAEGGFHLSLATKDYEVIGNKFKDPELLEVKK